jgi:hypothetical protein
VEKNKTKEKVSEVRTLFFLGDNTKSSSAAAFGIVFFGTKGDDEGIPINL